MDEAQYELEFEGSEYVAKFKKITLKDIAEHSGIIDAEFVIEIQGQGDYKVNGRVARKKRSRPDILR